MPTCRRRDESTRVGHTPWRGRVGGAGGCEVALGLLPAPPLFSLSGSSMRCPPAPDSRRAGRGALALHSPGLSRFPAGALLPAGPRFKRTNTAGWAWTPQATVPGGPEPSASPTPGKRGWRQERDRDALRPRRSPHPTLLQEAKGSPLPAASSGALGHAQLRGKLWPSPEERAA